MLGQELRGRDEHRAGGALACGQVFTSGSWQYPFGSAWVARDRWCPAQAASLSGPSGLSLTGCPEASTLRAFSQWSRTVLSDSRSGRSSQVSRGRGSSGRCAGGRRGTRAENVPPLVRGQVHGPAVLVADVAVFQPAVEHRPVGVAADRYPAVGSLPAAAHIGLQVSEVVLEDGAVDAAGGRIRTMLTAYPQPGMPRAAGHVK